MYTIFKNDTSIILTDDVNILEEGSLFMEGNKTEQ